MSCRGGVGRDAGAECSLTTATQGLSVRRQEGVGFRDGYVQVWGGCAATRPRVESRIRSHAHRHRWCLRALLVRWQASRAARRATSLRVFDGRSGHPEYIEESAHSGLRSSAWLTARATDHEGCREFRGVPRRARPAEELTTHSCDTVRHALIEWWDDCSWDAGRDRLLPRRALRFRVTTEGMTVDGVGTVGEDSVRTSTRWCQMMAGGVHSTQVDGYW